MVLLRPPRYEPDPVCERELAELMTARGARDGLVVVREIASAEGRPARPHATRSLLRGRPSTLVLVVTYSTRRRSDGWVRDAVEGATGPFHPLALLSIPLNGHTAEVRYHLTGLPCDVATELVLVLLRRGLVMHAVVQDLVAGTLRAAMPEWCTHAPRLVQEYDAPAVCRILRLAGLPEPERWTRLGRAVAFVIAYGSGASTLECAARHVGSSDPYAMLRDLRELTGIEANELVLRLGWRWVLEAWIQREAAEGGLSEDQVDRIAMLGRGPVQGLRCPGCGAVAHSHLDGRADA